MGYTSSRIVELKLRLVAAVQRVDLEFVPPKLGPSRTRIDISNMCAVARKDVCPLNTDI